VIPNASRPSAGLWEAFRISRRMPSQISSRMVAANHLNLGLTLSVVCRFVVLRSEGLWCAERAIAVNVAEGLVLCGLGPGRAHDDQVIRPGEV
jgi:hypothetical protein